MNGSIGTSFPALICGIMQIWYSHSYFRFNEKKMCNAFATFESFRRLRMKGRLLGQWNSNSGIGGKWRITIESVDISWSSSSFGGSWNFIRICTFIAHADGCGKSISSPIEKIGESRRGGPTPPPPTPQLIAFLPFHNATLPRLQSFINFFRIFFENFWKILKIFLKFVGNFFENFFGNFLIFF